MGRYNPLYRSWSSTLNRYGVPSTYCTSSFALGGMTQSGEVRGTLLKELTLSVSFTFKMPGPVEYHGWSD